MSLSMYKISYKNLGGITSEEVDWLETNVGYTENQGKFMIDCNVLFRAVEKSETPVPKRIIKILRRCLKSADDMFDFEVF